MKSVFSAFKGRKPDSSTSNSTGSKQNHNKNPITYHENSYASLRKIREADPFTKMSIATGDDLIDSTVLAPKYDISVERNGIEIARVSPTAETLIEPEGLTNIPTVIHHSDDFENNVDVETSETHIGHSFPVCVALGGLNGDDVRTLPPAKAPARPVSAEVEDAAGNASCVPVLSGDGNRLKSGDMNALRNKVGNRLGKRLSLTGIGNNLLPTVHGRAKSATEKTKTRFSHQRNLSLDFRSMGVLLPPVPQVASAHINLTQHHRNRSLDSALQRIPEVDILNTLSLFYGKKFRRN